MLKISGSLLQIYLSFLTVLLPINDIIQNQKLLNLPVQLFIVFSDPEFISTLVTNILNKSSQMAVLLITIAGSDCYHIGFRMGAFTRFLFGVIYDS